MESVVVTLEALAHAEPLRAEWLELEADSDASFFISWAWMGNWLASLPDLKHFRVLRVRRAGRLIGLGVLGRHVGRHLGPISARGLFLNATGVLAGGYIADMTKRHGDVAALGYGGAGVLILLVGLTPLHPILLVGAMSAAGFLAGMISPSRDMLVRAASPPGAFGRIFGIVTTGFNIGGTIGPLLGGWIMDHGMPRWIFFSSVLFMAATSLMGLMSERNTRRRLAAAPAGE